MSCTVCNYLQTDAGLQNADGTVLGAVTHVPTNPTPAGPQMGA
jgi:hypothetical protein